MKRRLAAAVMLLTVVRAVPARAWSSVPSAAGTAEKNPLMLCMILCAVSVICLTAAVLKYRSYLKQKEEDRFVDPLTGSGNKEYFIARFDEFVKSGSREKLFLACYSFDIAWVNRMIGREESEQLLCRMAGAFPEESRSSVSGRVAGGAVALLFSAEGEKEALREAGNYFELFNGYAREITGEHGTSVSGSLLPLKLFPGDGKDALKYALQEIPQGDSLQLTVCTEEDMRQTLEDAALLAQVPEALEKKRFQTYFQPIVIPETREIAGGEVLCRWDVGGTIIPPGRFLGMIYQLNLGDSFDYYMFERACAWLERLDEDGFSEIWITCNFSRKTISAENFPGRLEEISGKYHFCRRNLVLEITEEGLERSWSTAFANIRICRQAGFRIAIDDFGSGYTTFRNLLDYEADFLKLDRSLMLSADSERGRKLIREIIALAHGTGSLMICEGVETKEVCDLLKDCGCDYIQGYYFARPMPFGESLRILWEGKLG